MFKHLLVPVDGTELSEKAAQTAIDLAARLGAALTAFVAEPMPPLPNMGSSPSVYKRDADAHMARTEQHARQVLARIGERAKEQGVAYHGKFLRTDAIDEAIVDAAKEFECDLIVMATHGRGVFGELLFGSHTKNVMTRCKLPVLVLH
ncbi:universal stress protein [Rubrivivax gelatinosus]|uniref:Nucleotide-binding universal stress UspA family protein n=1 Tax=Rubrivivax gelatinosus TaxID=28068 RepID=A0A4R2M1W4_RUBGE|nr:universal stress protein [Rubrivivax gelatinosus]MBK1689176.1 universal stress protein [Rubrivivax gelatinosus]TCO97973.1 nucleotide-binding universal stress UspA family protein [Rubrivivax gelatinosus]